jgi:alpha-2-macroglobulin
VHFGGAVTAFTEDGFIADPLSHDAQLLYLVSKHFPELAKKVTSAQLDALLEPVFQGSYNTFSSAMLILGLESYGRTASAGDADKNGLSITQILPSGKQPLTLPASLLPVAHFAPEATALGFAASGDFGAYWLLEQKGYDRKVPDQAMAHKIEVFREYTDKAGKPIDKIAVGEELFVHVRLRAIDAEVWNVAITDLLPGGFEAVLQERPRQSGADENDGDEQAQRGSAEEGEGGDADEAAHADDGDGDGDSAEAHDSGGDSHSFWLPVMLEGDTTLEVDYGDVREDRVVIYTHAEKDVKELVYQLKATNVGSYRTAPVLADSMYDRSALSRSTGGHITVYRK